MRTVQNKPVFYDATKRRQSHLRRAGWLLAGIVTTFAVIFIASVLINPVLPELRLHQIVSLPTANDTALLPPPVIPDRRQQKALRAQAELKKALEKARAKAAPLAVSNSATAARPLALGFYVNWDDSSYNSLKRHLNQLDQLVPEWLRLQAGEYPVVPEIDPRALELIRRERPDLPIIPMIHNSKEGKWEPQILTAQIADDAARTRLVNALLQFVETNHFQGVCIDFEEVAGGSQKNLLAFMQQLHASFSAQKLIVSQAVPFDDPAWNYPAFAAANDYLMLMAYDEHWAEGTPGSVAGQPWFEAMLAQRMRELDGAKTIVCIGGFGYGWSKGKETEDCGLLAAGWRG